MLKTEFFFLFLPLKNIGEIFVDSYFENSWKHVVNSLIEEEEEGDEEQGDILLTADEIEKMGK